MLTPAQERFAAARQITTFGGCADGSAVCLYSAEPGGRTTRWIVDREGREVDLATFRSS